ncbi:phosphate ABC transporter substrate-binding protein, PhoT family [Halothece sp. PCC 7418]|uniref:PstS family phosphate ABC transporter substrate-binding protein n=1 Tax=Halothece sp. (strain PCC 7418) TaxID=65093 RepID=UPI0002A06160|nr:PstS family phosphate ABC transporter substrate-binding protein [Halothece sp. PCC 7418]AFZ45385.1 phosphate ABC transporter substrate-binding protein, PhoT family [Halothece sp. PCC 7418]
MLNQYTRRIVSFASVGALTVTLAACGNGGNQATDGGQTNNGGGSELSGSVAIDGSSTVFPITEAMAEEFQGKFPDVRVTVGVSGTGGGFKKFCNGETDISDASRPIKEVEKEACAEAGIEYIELPVAFDAISVIKNPENDWAECLTTEELETMWRPEAQGEINNWQQVRSSFPDRKLSLYGPGVDSGTFDYFTEAIAGEGGASRGDYTASEDDNVIVQGVISDEGGLGYLGLAYYEENQDKLAAVEIDDQNPDNGEGCIPPSAATVEEGTYQPLARPIFIYVSKSAAEEKPQVQQFIEFYMDSANRELVTEVGYVALSDSIYEKALTRFNERKTGTIFEDGSTVGVKLNEVL